MGYCGMLTFLSHTAQGEYAHALQLFVNMQADGIQGDIVAYNALVSAFANSGQSELVSRLS